MQFRIVHTESSLHWGGQELRVYSELLAMQKRGHCVWLAAPAISQIFQRSQAAGIPTIALDFRKWKYLSTINQLVSFLIHQRIDVVNTHSSRDGWVGGLAARLAHTPFLVRSRHVEVDYPNRWVSRWAFDGLPDYLLTTSHRISARMIHELHLSANQMSCLPTGIDLSRFHPQVKGTLREALSLSASTLLIGVVAVLRSWKGHRYFLEAAQHLTQKYTSVEFVIVGDGPGKEELKQRALDLGLAKKVHFLGHRNDVPEVLADLDVVVLPSVAHEGVPQIILQAQAMKKAVIGTTIGGIPEVIDSGVTGLLVPPENVLALSEAMAMLIDSSALREKLGHHAFQKAITQYSIDGMCQFLEKLYRDRLVQR